MSIARLENYPGLSTGPGFIELAYSTGNEDWPVARVRVTPETSDGGPRLHQPNAPVLPGRVVVVMSASLVDPNGQVLTIGGRLLVGAESRHARQFDAQAAFSAAAWVDSCAATMIAPLIRVAEGMAEADAAGLLPALAE